MQILSRSLPYFLAGTLTAFGAAACGDDDGDGGAADSGPTIDSAPDIDADVVELLRSGTVAVTETTITNTGGAVNGALVRMSFADETTRTVAPVPGFESSVNACSITIYNVGDDEPPDPADEGTFAVTGTAAGPFGCAYVAALGEYVCQSATAAVAGGSAEGATVTGAGGNAQFALTGLSFPDGVVGMHMQLSGFPPVDEVEVDGVYPIVGANTVGETTTLTLFGAPFTGASTGDADASYATYVGLGPVPGGADFLDDGTADLTISKTAGDVVGAFEVELNASGAGLTLIDDAANDYYLPHEIPTEAAAEVKFGCTGDGCGAAGSGILSAMIISGATTDGTLPVDGDPAGIAMPDPVSQYATFTCSALGADEVAISMAAMQAILGTSPTRIQVSVGRVVGEIHAADDGSYQTFVLAGHSLLGFTTVAAE